MPNIHVFAVSNETNIWAGIGAGLWAVAENNEPSHLREARARKVQVGSFGLLYRSDKENESKALTTPFVILSAPDPHRVEERVWDGRWVYPFRIQALGTPRKMYSISEARKELDILRDAGGNWANDLHLSPTMAFNPVLMSDVDWGRITARLCNLTV